MHVRLTLVVLLLDAVLDCVLGGAQTGRGADIGVFGDAERKEVLVCCGELYDEVLADMVMLTTYSSPSSPQRRCPASWKRSSSSRT